MGKGKQGGKREGERVSAPELKEGERRKMRAHCAELSSSAPSQACKRCFACLILNKQAASRTADNSVPSKLPAHAVCYS